MRCFKFEHEDYGICYAFLENGWWTLRHDCCAIIDEYETTEHDILELVQDGEILVDELPVALYNRYK